MKFFSSVLFAGIISPAVVFGDPSSLEVFEDFEGISPNTSPGQVITLGGGSAELSGNAFAGVVGEGSLYHSGVRSWMVLENSMGRIEFTGANASQVEFFVKTHAFADGNTTVSAFDDAGQLIDGSTTVINAGSQDPSDPASKGFTLISITGDIDHILIENHATNRMNGVEDIGYTLIPEPSTLGMLSLASLVTIKRRRRGK